MRFGFFFFAEYVNVFVMSALIVTFFVGGWTAPFAWPWPVDLSAVDPLGLGVGLLVLIAIGPVVGTIVCAVPFWLASRFSTLQALVLGFVVFNVLAILGGHGLGIHQPRLGRGGSLWFFAKTYVFIFIFVWMRGSFPRVRIDQLMGLAWKWLLPAALLNIFVTASAVLILNR